MMNYKKLVLSANEVQKIVKKEYGIEGSPSMLQGEIDINYKISTKDAQDYVMAGTGYNVNMKAFNTITRFLEENAESK